MTTITRTVFVIASLAVAAPVAAQGTWVGKTVLVKKAGIKIGHTGPDGKYVNLAELKSISYRVLGEENGWLKVNDGRGTTGWFPKADAVLLEDAVNFFTDRIRQNPQDANAYGDRAAAWSLKGEVDIAIKDLDEAIRLNPIAEYYTSRGIAWSKKKEYDKAIADYSEALRIDPKLSNAYLGRGNTWSDKKEYDKAIADYSEALRIDPKYVFAYRGRGNTWSDKKEYDKAIADYSEALRIDPKFANAYNSRAWLWATCPEARYRDGKRAVESAKQAVDLEKEKGIYLGTLAAAYAETGDFSKAIRWQEKALEDPGYRVEFGEGAQRRLQLYRDQKPYREE